MPRLTEQEQQEIIRYLEADKPLPEKYRFLLFEDVIACAVLGIGCSYYFTTPYSRKISLF